MKWPWQLSESLRVFSPLEGMDPGGLAPFHLKEVSSGFHPPKIRATEETVAGDEKGGRG